MTGTGSTTVVKKFVHRADRRDGDAPDYVEIYLMSINGWPKSSAIQLLCP